MSNRTVAHIKLYKDKSMAGEGADTLRINCTYDSSKGGVRSTFLYPRINPTPSSV
jgi:hypothetical protein